MAIEVKLPKLGQSMTEASLISFKVNVGDEVKKTDPIFEIETDKVALDVESPAEGFVKFIIAEPGQTLSVGQPILILGDKDEKIPTKLIASLKSKLTPPPPTQKDNDLSLDDTIIAPQAADTNEPIPQIKLGATIPMGRLQKLTAQRMVQSKRQIPAFYMTVNADVTDIVNLRTELNETNKTSDTKQTKISYNVFIIKALAIGLKKFPMMTGQILEDKMVLADKINIGLAVFTDNGLVVPVIKDVANKNITQIAHDTNTLIEKARKNKLQLTDLEAACITVSNLGAFGIESFIPIIIPGQCSILGVGKIADVCTPDNGDMKIRKSVSLTLSVDHKIVNGAYAAQFLDFSRKVLENTPDLV